MNDEHALYAERLCDRPENLSPGSVVVLDHRPELVERELGEDDRLPGCKSLHFEVVEGRMFLMLR